MLIDLLSTDCYVSYNCELANVIGLHSAIYVTELINISRKAASKHKLIDGKFFIVDRDYISHRTTIAAKEQETIDKALQELNIIQIGNIKDAVYIDIEVLSGLLLNGEDIQAKAKKVVESVTKPKDKKLTQKQQIANTMKQYIYATNSELYVAYVEWIEAVCDKVGWMSKKSVQVGQQIVDEYAKGDLDVALKLIELATMGGYRDMAWAVESYEKDCKKTCQTSPKPVIVPKKSVSISDEVF